MPRPVPAAGRPQEPLIPAVALGAALGLLGALRNGVRFPDERLLWVLGGSAGAAIEWAIGAWLGLACWTVGSLLAALLTPRLDAARSRRAWLASACLKAAQCPLTTAVGFLLATLGRSRRPRLLLRGGAGYAEVGEGRWAVALGGIVVAQRAMFDAEGEPHAWVVRHESYHTRNAACLGECGFYLAYLSLGAAWALARRAPWNGLAEGGHGNPFERTAHALGREAKESPRA